MSNPEPDDVQESEKVKPKNKKEKKNTKVQKNGKRGKDENAEKTKSKGFCRRFLSLFCCCFKSQEKDDKNCEMEQSTPQKSTAHVEDASQGSFVTIDLNE